MFVKKVGLDDRLGSLLVVLYIIKPYHFLRDLSRQNKNIRFCHSIAH